jgi:hypothetical protein
MGMKQRIRRRQHADRGSAPAAEPRRPRWRGLLWLFSTDTGSVLAISLLVALSLLVGHADAGDARSVLLLLPLGLVVGVFLAVIVVTETRKTYVRSGARIRIVTGAAAGAAIAVMLGASFEGIALGVLVGCVLGYLGKLWAQFI